MSRYLFLHILSLALAALCVSPGFFRYICCNEKTKRKLSANYGQFSIANFTQNFVILGGEVWGFCTKSIRAIRSQKFVFLNRFLQSKTKRFGGHKCFLWGHCFALLVTSVLGFKARLDFLACTLCCLCATDSSDSPLVQHLMTS